MDTPTSTPESKSGSPPHAQEDYKLFFFSQLLKRRICAGKINDKIGRVTDLVFRLAEPYPDAVGIYVEHSMGRPNELIPWEKVIKIDDDAIFIVPPKEGKPFPSFVDQKGWILLGQHFIGRTILDMDGRQTEVVNDVQLLYSKNRMIIVHVDTSFNGFLRKWGLERFKWSNDQLIAWKYVQPLSLEDIGTTDAVSLSITRDQIKELPGEDLADAIETLPGEVQHAVFSVLDSEKAAEVLVEAEPRAQRQLIANIRRERARTILSEMSVPQLADLFSVLPHDQMNNMMALLPPDLAARIQAIISDLESTADALMSSDFVTAKKTTSVGQILRQIRSAGHEPHGLSYIYLVDEERTLLGVVDLREIVVAADTVLLADIMVAPVVAAQQDDTREDLAELFARYQFHLIPVVDEHDRLLGVVHYRDIMKGLVARAKT
ncbi:MAG TPA: CBS domain-containing protein [Chthoniobacterales bacterium]|nr:CBS domain-containing protein [Chthoniobacterales bacterium]